MRLLILALAILFTLQLGIGQNLNSILNFKHLPNETALLHGLSNKSQLVRDSCAKEIRNILYERTNVIMPGNIIEHKKEYWDKAITSLPTNYNFETLVSKLDLTDKPNLVFFGGSGGSITYTLDNTFKLRVSLTTAPQKGEKSKIKKIELVEDINFIYDNPDSTYTGLWRNYYINGNLKLERSLEKGAPNGISNYYSPTGNLMTSEFYQNRSMMEQRTYYKNGFLRTKTTVINKKGDREIVKFDRKGNIVFKELNKKHLHKFR